MHSILFQLFVFTLTFSSGITQEESLPYLEDNIFLAANVEKLPCDAPDFVDADNASFNVDEILKELSVEQARTRNLNQTISDLLGRMADMEKIIKDLTEEVSAVQEDVVSVADDVERNSAIITNQATRGSWCAFKLEWTTGYSIITYDYLTFSDTNMEITETPLNSNTGDKIISHVKISS